VSVPSKSAGPLKICDSISLLLLLLLLLLSNTLTARQTSAGSFEYCPSRVCRTRSILRVPDQLDPEGAGTPFQSSRGTRPARRSSFRLLQQAYGSCVWTVLQPAPCPCVGRDPDTAGRGATLALHKANLPSNPTLQLKTKKTVLPNRTPHSSSGPEPAGSRPTSRRKLVAMLKKMLYWSLERTIGPLACVL